MLYHVDDREQATAELHRVTAPGGRCVVVTNGADVSSAAFDDVQVIRPQAGPTASITDASIAADYVATTTDNYADETSRPWSDVVDEVRTAVHHEIDTIGSFALTGDTGAFICR